MSKLRYKEGGVWKSIAPSQKEFDDNKAETASLLAEKLNKGGVAVSDINKNLGKFDQTYMTTEFIQQIAGTAPVNAVPADDSLTTLKFADKSVTKDKVSFIEMSNNLFDINRTIYGKRIDGATGNLIDDANNAVINYYIYVVPGEKITAKTSNSVRVAWHDKNGVFLSSSIASTPPSNTFTAPVNARLLRFSFYFTGGLDITLMVNRGETLLTYESFLNKIADELSVDGKNYKEKSISSNHVADKGIKGKNLSFLTQSSNLIDLRRVLKGFRLDSANGQIIVDATGNNNVTDYYIDAKSSTPYTVFGQDTARLMYYDKNFTFIAESIKYNTQNQQTFTSPSKTRYIRASLTGVANLPRWQINEGATLLPYKNYHEKVDDYVRVPAVNHNNHYIPAIVEAWNAGRTPNAETITVAQIYALWDALIAQFPQYLTKTNLGRDASNTFDIFSIRFKPVAPIVPIKKFLVSANIHGGGSNGDPKDVAIEYYLFFKALLEDRGLNAALNFIKFNMEIHIIPIANPYGFENDLRANLNAVDLNRDFDKVTPQAETVIIKDWLAVHSDADLYTDAHAIGSGSPQLTGIIVFQNGLNLPETRVMFDTGQYVGNNQGRTFTYNPAVEGMAIYYAKNTLGIKSNLIEFPPYSQNDTPRSSDMMTDYQEWVGDYLYRFAVSDF